MLHRGLTPLARRSRHQMKQLWDLLLLSLTVVVVLGAAPGVIPAGAQVVVTSSSQENTTTTTTTTSSASTVTTSTTTAADSQKREQEAIARETDKHRQTVSVRGTTNENACMGVENEEQCEHMMVKGTVAKGPELEQLQVKTQTSQLVKQVTKSQEKADESKQNGGKREIKPLQTIKPSTVKTPGVETPDGQHKEVQREQKTKPAKEAKEKVVKLDPLQKETREIKENGEKSFELSPEIQPKPSQVKQLINNSPESQGKSSEINPKGGKGVQVQPSSNNLKKDVSKEAKDSGSVGSNSEVKSAKIQSVEQKNTIEKASVKSEEGKHTEGKNIPRKPTESEPAMGKPSEVKPTETKPSEVKLTQDKTKEVAPPSETPTSSKTNTVKANDKSNEIEGTPAKEVNEKPAQQSNGKPPVVKPSVVKSIEGKPHDAKPVTTKPNAVKQSEVKTNAVKPSEVKTNAVKPSEVKTNAVKPSEVKTNAVKPSEVKTNAVKPSEVKTNAVKPNEVKTKEVKPSGKQFNDDNPSAVKPADAKPVLNADAWPGRTERPARILAVMPYNARSHFVFFGPLFRALAERGHHVDVVSHFPTEKPPPGYRDFTVNGSFPSFEDAVDLDFVAELNAFTDAIQLWYETLDVCSNVLEHPSVRKLLRSTDQYDLVLSEVFGAECLLGFAHKFNTPLVGLISSVAPPASLARIGNPEHPAYVSNYFLPFVPPLNFWQRAGSALYGVAFRRLKTLLCDRATDAIGRRYFGEGLPSTEELASRTSLVLINSHPAVNQPRPFVPGAVEVGGMHIGEPKPLPEAVERVVSGATHGIVVVSLGTMVRLASFPPERLAALWAALGALPQTVIVKSKEKLPGAPPPNVHAFAWLPQFDLLSHPRTRLFLWHGGLLGGQEAVAAGVPMLGMPLFADQRLNVNVLVAKGAALLLEHHDLSRERLAAALHTLLNDPSFRERARVLQSQFLDRPQKPLRSAVWWVEYVLRHEGAPHLRSAAADMPTYQLLLMDVLAAVALVIILVGAIVWITLSAVYRAIRFGSTRPKARLPTVDGEGRAKRYSKTKQH